MKAKWPLALSTQYAVSLPVLFVLAFFTEKGNTLIEYFMYDDMGVIALVLFIIMLIVFIPLTSMFTTFLFIVPVSIIHKKNWKKITKQDIEAESVDEQAFNWFEILVGKTK
jgi:hypothetical protein